MYLYINIIFIYSFNFIGENRRTVLQMSVWQEWLNCYQTVILLSFIMLFMTLLSKNCIFKYFLQVRIVAPSCKCPSGKNGWYPWPISIQKMLRRQKYQIWFSPYSECYCTMPSNLNMEAGESGLIPLLLYTQK